MSSYRYAEIRDTLLVFGFIDVTSWEEGNTRISMSQRVNCWYINNGMFCIVDKLSHSWVAPVKTLDMAEVKKFLEGYENARIYVPFSNDGGKFARDVWPWVFEK